MKTRAMFDGAPKSTREQSTTVDAATRLRATPAEPRPPALLKQFTAIDQLRDMSFVALVDAGGGTLQIGVLRYSTYADGSTCECAVVVSDEWQNRGVATLLMRHLVEYAKSHGIRRMYSVDSSANEHMHELAVDFGFVRRPDPDDAAQVLHVLDLQATAH